MCSVLMFYTIFVVLTEGVYSGGTSKKTRVDPIYVQQQEMLRSGHHAGAAHEAGANHEGGHEKAPH